MLLSLIGAILFTFGVSTRGRLTALRGAVLGLFVSGLLGLVMPTNTVRDTGLSTVRLEKSWVSSDTPLSFSALAMDDHNRINVYACPMAKTTVTITDDPAVHFYVCHRTLAASWMNFVALRYPTETYEIEVPRTMADSILSPADPTKTTVVYSATTDTSKALANAK